MDECLDNTHLSGGPRAPHQRSITSKCEEPNKAGRAIGIEPGIVKGADLLERTLSPLLENEPGIVRMMWKWWSHAAHSDLPAGMSLYVRSKPVPTNFRVGAAMLAAGAHVMAYQRLQKYFGQCDELTFQQDSAAMMAPLLTETIRRRHATGGKPL